MSAALLPLGVAAGVFVALVLVLAGVAARLSVSPAVASTPGRAGRVVTALSSLARPGEQSERERMRSRLVQAGLRGKRALELYQAVRAGLTLALPGLAWAWTRPQRPLVALLVVLSAATVAYYLPALTVGWLRERRQQRLRAAFPNALDMLVSCLEAGLGLDVALRHVAEELGGAAAEFGRELSLVNTELAAGVHRLDALHHMHERTGLDEIGSLVNELAQAERYGSQIAVALRVHARHTRAQRILDAERRAAEATPKLTVVMVLFVLPPLFIVLLGPTVVTLVERFDPGILR